MISTACMKFSICSAIPCGIAEKLRGASIGENNGTWGEVLGARALFIAQAIVSIVAAPLTLLALLFAPFLALCMEDKEAAKKNFKQLGFMLLNHVTFIPTTLIAAFVPHSLKWNAPMLPVAKCFVSCFGEMR